MTDFWTHYSTRMKAIASTFAVIAFLGGWFWSVFVVADDARDAKIVAETNDKRIDTLEKDVLIIKNDIERVKKDVNQVSKDVSIIKETQIINGERDKYQTELLERALKALEEK